MPEGQTMFDEKELSEIIIELSKINYEAKTTRPIRADWEDIKKKFQKYLERFKTFAKENRASQLNIEVTIGWPPGLNLGLTFDLSQ